MYGLAFVSYRDIPHRFDRYSEDDQARIAARMLAVLEANERGIDLVTDPLLTKSIPLKAALAALRGYGGQWDSGQWAVSLIEALQLAY